MTSQSELNRIDDDETDDITQQTSQITTILSQTTATNEEKRMRNGNCSRTIDIFATKFKQLVKREQEKRKDGRRSIAVENQWLLNAGLFDPQGNYSKHCSTCLQKHLKVGFPRLSRLRKLHNSMLTDPNVPQHGLKSKRSNRALSSQTHSAFQIFVQEISQPNGRTEKYEHNRSFDPQFTRIFPPPRNVFDTWTEAQKRGVLLYEFNRLQLLRREEELDALKKKEYQTISKGTLAKWLKQYCPRTGIIQFGGDRSDKKRRIDDKSKEKDKQPVKKKRRIEESDEQHENLVTDEEVDSNRNDQRSIDVTNSELEFHTVGYLGEERE